MNSSLPLSKKRREEGYATVFTIAFFAAIALAVFSLYDVGWVASERIRLQNTADNTVYSTVNVQTRDLNMIAITNRAMIANQVVIGQYIGLVSWSNEVNEFAQNLETLGQFAQVIPYVGPFIKKATDILAKATDAMVDFFEAGDFIIDTVQENIIYALSEFQRVNHALTLAANYSVYQDVLARNDPDVTSSMAGSAVNIKEVLESWGGDIQRFERNNVAANSKGGDNRTTQRFNEFSNLVNDSRDKFSANRSYRFFKKVDVGFYEFWGEKNGGSDFIPVEVNNKGKSVVRWNWTAADTLSFYQKFDLGFGISWTSETPLGWGAAHSLNKDRIGDRFKYEGYKNNSRRNYDEDDWEALDYAGGNEKRWWGGAWINGDAARNLKYPSVIGSGKVYEYNNIKKTKGLRDFYDFKDDAKTDEMPEFSIFLSKGEGDIRTQKTVDNSMESYSRIDRLTIESDGGMAGNRLYASGSAQSFFARPDESHYGSREFSWNVEWGRSDGLHEYGNLYNPFWQTRLVEDSRPLLSMLISFGAL
ncbi:pilus assembly protein TadG-related protein [uncultured Gilvimarinus sp.]|uniref:pilus assembly protein TadG-related protein n=1 Tax=uncultured Gilvimarinus sp. TaxID=1689143 RepID=UPI0030EB13D9|tara:strand:- start:11429 stop:13024 length:1596 start_codon:yes stop_codon:yes gene_type:complete